MRRALPLVSLGFFLVVAACGGSGSSSSSTDVPSEGATGGASGHGGSSGTHGGGASGSSGTHAGGSAGTGGSATGGKAGASGKGGAGGASGKGGSSTGGVGGKGGSSTGGSSTGGKAGTSACGDTSSDPKNCGSCGHVCATGPNANATCVAGTCQLSCATGFGDCDQIASTGCESDLGSDPAHCGACSMACGTGAMCIQGACQCAGSTQSASLVPLDMVIMLDHSGSMAQSGKWPSVTMALDQFFADPGAAGLGVGLAFFPYSSGKDTQCKASNYSNLVVPIATLPGNATALTNAVAAESPNGGNTPTVPALQGALDAATAWKNAHQDHIVVVVLATDGQPNGCGTIANVDTVAASGLAANPPIKTYVIGVGSSTGNLDSIAMSGGTGKAFPVNNGDASGFLAALKTIQGQSLGCTYQLPTPMPGQSLDFGKVNVVYTPGGGTPVTLPNVADASGCSAHPDGWYYDDASAPTKIELCSNECSTVKADMNAKIAIELGCATMKP